MAQVPTTIIDKIKKYIKELEKNNIHIKTAILFGSYSNGNYNEWSDIDVALVSDNFEGIRFYDKEKIRRTTLDVDYRLSPLPYKIEDFDESNLFVKEILETGTRIV